MSNTYSIVCRPMKIKLWIGQQSRTSGFSLYAGGEYDETLGKFFGATLGQPLEVIIDGCDDESPFYEEFKP